MFFHRTKQFAGRTTRAHLAASARRGLPWVSAVFLGLTGAAYADDYGYMGTGSGVANFGVVDLTTGAFSKCGLMQSVLSGFGVGQDRSLYGGGYLSNTFYKVDLTNGNLTAVGTSTIKFFLTGSTNKSMYAIGLDSNLYSVDTAGAVTLIGPLGITVSTSGWWSLSTNSSALYFSVAIPLGQPSTLYKLNLTTGAAELIGTTSDGEFGATVLEGDTLYAGSEKPKAIFDVNTADGSATLLAHLSGKDAANPWALAPIKATHITHKKVCAAHKI